MWESDLVRLAWRSLRAGQVWEKSFYTVVWSKCNARDCITPGFSGQEKTSRQGSCIFGPDFLLPGVLMSWPKPYKIKFLFKMISTCAIKTGSKSGAICLKLVGPSDEDYLALNVCQPRASLYPIPYTLILLYKRKNSLKIMSIGGRTRDMALTAGAALAQAVLERQVSCRSHWGIPR